MLDLWSSNSHWGHVAFNIEGKRYCAELNSHLLADKSFRNILTKKAQAADKGAELLPEKCGDWNGNTWGKEVWHKAGNVGKYHWEVRMLQA